MTKHTYTISPIRSDFSHRVRTLGLDDQDQPVERLVASGGEPCRDVLRPALPGEEIILASYCPFQIPGPYKEYGPVFVLAVETDVLVDLSSLPLTGPHPYISNNFVLRAYSTAERIVDAVITTPANAEAQVRSMFMRNDIDFVHARFGAYGCYALRIDRD